MPFLEQVSLSGGCASGVDLEGLSSICAHHELCVMWLTQA